MEWTDMMDEKLSTLYSENPVGLSKKPAIKKIEKAYNETISRFYSTDR